jgi:hypothetical protein
MAAPTPPSTGGIAMAGATAVAGFAGSYTAAKQAEAQGYYQQAANLVQAQENMRMSGLRADKEVNLKEHREHPTLYFRKGFKKESIDTLQEFNKLKRKIENE